MDNRPCVEGMKLGHNMGNKNKSDGSEFCRRQWTNGWRQTRIGTHKVRKTGGGMRRDEDEDEKGKA